MARFRGGRWELTAGREEECPAILCASRSCQRLRRKVKMCPVLAQTRQEVL